MRWHLYCRVVDNFGDVGIAWRLARQLARERPCSVRLMVDDLDAFARIEPRVAVAAASQTIEDVRIDAWPTHPDTGEEPAVVIEMFGCGLPRVPSPGTVWLDFEYLSAEAWVDDFHGLPSPLPDATRVKHFFYPGFGPRTGGLLREDDLEGRRRDFLASPDAIAAFWTRIGLQVPAPGERRLTMFAYPGVPSSSLFDYLVGRPDRTSVVIPMPTAARPARRVSGALTLLTMPFVGQDDYDRLLWACDLNFVRGEDSFVRAQWAGRPMVWQPYVQDGDTHLAKLAAFEARASAGLSQSAREAQHAVWRAWNGDGLAGDAQWRAWFDALPELAAHAERWRVELAASSSLVERLAAFVAEKRSALVD